jgi:hypothetical protein
MQHAIVVLTNQQRFKSTENQAGTLAPHLRNKRLYVHIMHVASQPAEGITAGPGTASVPVLT